MAGRPLVTGAERAPNRGRVYTSCSMMGQASGIAAALGAQRGCDPRELDPAEVRGIVEKRGAELGV